MNDRLRGARIGMAREQHIDTLDSPGKCYVSVDIALQPGVCFGVGLHRRGLALVGKQDDEIDLVAQLID